MAAVTICSDFGAQENKACHVSVVSPSIYHEMMGPAAMTLVFWILSFKPTFSLFLFHFHQETLQFLFASIWPLTFTDSKQFFPKCRIKITGWLLKRTWFSEQTYWIISRKGMWTSFVIYVLKHFWSHCRGLWDLSSPTGDGTDDPSIRSTKSFFFFIVVDFVIHWNETAMGLHVFPIPIPPPTSLSTQSL